MVTFGGRRKIRGDFVVLAMSCFYLDHHLGVTQMFTSVQTYQVVTERSVQFSKCNWYIYKKYRKKPTSLFITLRLMNSI